MSAGGVGSWLTRRPDLPKRGVLGRWWIPALMAVVSLAACGGGTSSAAATVGSSGCTKSQIHLVYAGRGLDNPYYVVASAGAKAFADTVGLGGNYQFVASGGDSQKQLSQIKALLASYGKCLVLNVDPNENSILPAIVSAVDTAGASLVTQWNKPDNFNPWDNHPHWVAHMTFDGVTGGYEIAKAEFAKMGGKGNIVAIQGILDNVPAQQRYAGLQKALAENPQIHLLDQQTALWQRTKAHDITQTWLTKYGAQLDGVWAANDDMGLGALEALRAAGLAGKVPVVGIDAVPDALKAIKEGTFTATVASDAAYQGGEGLAIGYGALIGKINPAKEPQEHRSFYAKEFVITSAEVDKWLAPPDYSTYNWTDYWGRVVRVAT